MTKAIKQAHNYLLIVHFDTRSSRNGKNPHSRSRLSTLYKTNCCCRSFQSFYENSVNEDVYTGIELYTFQGHPETEKFSIQNSRVK
jgi:hypothetical protein